MESLIIFLFLIGMLVASILILQIYKLLKEKTLGKAITELPSPVKQEIKRTPSYSPFLDENRADLMRKHILRGIGIFFLIVVIMVATAIKEDFSIIIALITSAIIGVSIFLLLVKDHFKYTGKELYEVRAFCDYRINLGNRNTARVFYYNFKTQIFEADIMQNISSGRELKAGQFCYVIVKVKKQKLVPVDISPREFTM